MPNLGSVARNGLGKIFFRGQASIASQFTHTVPYPTSNENLQDTLNSAATLGYPFLFVLQTATGSTAGAPVVGLIVVALGVCSTQCG